MEQEVLDEEATRFRKMSSWDMPQLDTFLGSASLAHDFSAAACKFTPPAFRASSSMGS